MRVFQSTYKDRQGRTRKTKKWYVEFRDHLGIVRRVPGFTDRKATEALGRRIVELVNLRAGAESLPPELTRWLETLPTKLLTVLARIGLVTGGKVAALRPLAEHLDGAADAPGWRQHLAAKGNTAGHIAKSCSRVKKILDGCGFTFWSDISASKVLSYLHDLRADKKNAKGETVRGISAQTFNYYLTAFKSFCKWMVKDRRASESPVSHLDGLNVKTDRRHDRRALDVEELRWLLDTTRKAPERHGMTGPARSLLYKLAVETGLRRAELASLTPASFALNGDNPTVTVEAGYSKHRREDVLPLRADTAAELRDFLAVKLSDAAAFNMPIRRHDSSAMWKADLADAREAWLADAPTPQDRQKWEESSFPRYEDAAGRFADFHALRHTAGSLLAASGAHPKVAQSVMRHSTIELTMSRYSHVFAGQEADAVAALPDLDAAPAKQRAKATGTDNAKAVQDATGRPRTGDPGQGRPAGPSDCSDARGRSHDRRGRQGRFCLGRALGA
ncbi:MAG: tyrosine-type recombinase/integrase [Planctomycetota bacterium]|jgi:integrase